VYEQANDEPAAGSTSRGHAVRHSHQAKPPLGRRHGADRDVFISREVNERADPEFLTCLQPIQTGRQHPRSCPAVMFTASAESPSRWSTPIERDRIGEIAGIAAAKPATPITSWRNRYLRFAALVRRGAVNSRNGPVKLRA
jgi:hypothetical protein